MLTDTGRDGQDWRDGQDVATLRPDLSVLPFPPFLPFLPLVRRDRGCLDREGDVLRLARADGHALGYCAALFVPRLNRVRARREPFDIELALVVGHREERVIEH